MTYADNGFGELVSTSNPYGFTTAVYMRDNGKLAKYEIGTADHAIAIQAVRDSNNDHRLSRFGRWRNGPVLAVIQGGRA